MVLVIGSGLIGTKLVKKLLNDGQKVFVIDPFLSNELTKIQSSLLSTYCGNFDEFVDEKINENIFTAIVNTAYPVKRDINSKIFPNPNEFKHSISEHISLYYNVMFHSKGLLVNGSGSVVSAASMYSTFMPRPELYEDSIRSTPVDYIASKSAIIYMNKFFAKLYDGEIYFNTISFGGVNNNHENDFVEKYGKHTKSKKMLNGNEVVNGIIFLLRSIENKVNGHNLIIDDGFTL